MGSRLGKGPRWTRPGADRNRHRILRCESPVAPNLRRVPDRLQIQAQGCDRAPTATQNPERRRSAPRGSNHGRASSKACRRKGLLAQGAGRSNNQRSHPPVRARSHGEPGRSEPGYFGMSIRPGSVRNSARDSGLKDGDNSTASRVRAHLPEPERRYRHGDRLPDTARSVDRVFVEYPAVGIDEMKQLMKAGKPVPMAGHVIGTIRRKT